MRVEQIGDATLYHGDCRDVIPTLDRMDAIVTDPPYGIGYARNSIKTYGFAALRKSANKNLGGKRARPIIGDNEPFNPTHLLQRTTRLILWGASAYSDKLPSNYGWLIWDKQIIGDWSGGDCETAWTNFLNSNRIFRHRWQGMMRDGEECPVRGGDRRLVHPTQKPVALMAWCIDKIKSPISICDPYMGSGTTGVAAVKRGISFVGIEIDETYFDIACRRIDEATRQPDMFVPSISTPETQATMDFASNGEGQPQNEDTPLLSLGGGVP